MIINNELVNQLVRSGDSRATFSLQPSWSDIAKEQGRYLQAGDRIPFLDAILGLIAAAERLHVDLVHPLSLSGLSVSKSVWENVVVSLERITPAQKDLVDPAPKVIDSEVKAAKKSHSVAVRALEHWRNDPSMTMDTCLALINSSPNKQLTKDLLLDGHEGHTGWISSGGKLPPLDAEFPATLPSSKHLEVEVRVLDVNELAGIAAVEISEYRDARTRGLLEHHLSRVELRFNKTNIERDDLILFQYLKKSAWIRVMASCATHARHAKKTSLTLAGFVVNRTALDQWHVAARQLPMPFFEDAN